MVLQEIRQIACIIDQVKKDKLITHSSQLKNRYLFVYKYLSKGSNELPFIISKTMKQAKYQNEINSNILLK